ncbi:AAA family ATPase [Aureitalea marina]|uniref:NadR/Ttd14 AAA domain-containing protein n=1 Tax=Aureitalea marina TaxID=930804 RepID=A0A2S7KT87_9FLAO|nr:ATP-binding protein [Aureitalea marina]PQB05798.1 hypothetical protein BST85_13510 [Aureitalea marina]
MEESLIQQHPDCLRFVFFGPESTGKTTLAAQIADHFDTVWVEEQMRSYLQNKLDETGLTCTREDLLPIAMGQMAEENLKAQGRKLIFCDTNLVQLETYAQYYYQGFCPEAILQANKRNHYVHYFLTDIDVPWVADDLRDRPNSREELFTIFERKLMDYGLPYTVLSGTLEDRLKVAVSIVHQHA